jgi:hypothetical protein
MGEAPARAPIASPDALSRPPRQLGLAARIPQAGRELGLVALALTAIAAAVYGGNAIHGGFLSDAWSNRALYEFAPGNGPLDALSHILAQPNIAVRPLLGVYLVTLNASFGAHMGYWLTWLIATNVAMALALFLLLRRLSLGALDAAVIAALVLLFPAASSLRLWAAMVAAPATITLALLGFLVALSALERDDRRSSLALHAVSLVLFAASVLLYELMLPLMLSSVLLYRLRVPWRPAISRWLVDCLVLIAIALTVTRSSDSGFMQSSAGMWHHATTIFSQARTLLATTVLPFASARWSIVLLIALVPAVALAVYRYLPATSPVRPELRRWLVTMAAGCVVVAFGYVIFIPAVDYYTPLGAGIANRINAVPSIGWVLILYSGAMLFATLAFRELPKARLLSSGLATLACALIAISWIKTLDSESDAYTRAFGEDERVLQVIRTALPDPPPYSTIWTFGQPVEIIPGVPVFGNTWDMTTSVQLTYDDPTINSYVALPETSFYCLAHGIAPGGAYQEDGTERPNRLLGSPYGRTYFVDTVDGRVRPIRTARECHEGALEFQPSPALPTG